MKETFFIRTIDLDRLDYAIDRQWHKIDKTDLYIFMNIDTYRSFYEEIQERLDMFTLPNISSRSPLGLYMGCKVFEDNTLEYGEIEIR